MLTQKELKENLHYNPDTGIFTWIKSAKGRNLISSAGTLDKSTGYIRINIFGKVYYAHRLAFLYIKGYIPEEVDHQNHIRNDNWWNNLKQSSRKENCKNLKINCKNRSGQIGVRWNKHCMKWIARINVNKKEHHLGVFINKVDAIKARKDAELKHGFHYNHGK